MTMTITLAMTPEQVRLAVSRARATGAPAIFWLDEKRAHDANLIGKVNAYLTPSPYPNPKPYPKSYPNPDPNHLANYPIPNQVNTYLKDHDTSGIDISIKAPVDAVKATMANARQVTRSPTLTLTLTVTLTVTPTPALALTLTLTRARARTPSRSRATCCAAT